MFKMTLQNVAGFKNFPLPSDITLSVAHRVSPCPSSPETASIKEIIEMVHLGMKSQMSKKNRLFL